MISMSFWWLYVGLAINCQHIYLNTNWFLFLGIAVYYSTYRYLVESEFSDFAEEQNVLSRFFFTEALVRPKLWILSRVLFFLIGSPSTPWWASLFPVEESPHSLPFLLGGLGRVPHGKESCLLHWVTLPGKPHFQPAVRSPLQLPALQLGITACVLLRVFIHHGQRQDLGQLLKLMKVNMDLHSSLRA